MTEKPFSIALTPRATDRCVFPTPGGPWMSSVSLARTQAQVASVSTRERSTEGWEGEGEARQGLSGGKSGEPKRGLDPSFLALVELDVQEPVEERVLGQLRLGAVGVAIGQVLGAVAEPQARQSLDGGVEVDLGAHLARGAHRATSASAAYRSSGRLSGARAAISAMRVPMRPNGAGAMTVSVDSPWKCPGSSTMRWAVARG